MGKLRNVLEMKQIIPHSEPLLPQTPRLSRNNTNSNNDSPLNNTGVGNGVIEVLNNTSPASSSNNQRSTPDS